MPLGVHRGMIFPHMLCSCAGANTKASPDPPCKARCVQQTQKQEGESGRGQHGHAGPVLFLCLHGTCTPLARHTVWH